MVDEITRSAPPTATRQEPARSASVTRGADDRNASEQVRNRDRVSISNEAREALAEDNRRLESRAEADRVETARLNEQRAKKSTLKRTEEATSRRAALARADDADIEARESKEPPDRNKEYNDRTRA